MLKNGGAGRVSVSVDGAISGRSLLKPFEIRVLVIEGFGEKVSGYVSYDGRQGLMLDVMAVRGGTDRARAGMPARVERAIGVLETGEYVTLEDMFVRQSPKYGERHTAIVHRYRVYKMFVGGEALDAEEFDGIDIRFEKLLEWADQPAFTKNHEDAIAGRTSFEYKQPPTLKFTLGDGTMLDVDFSQRTPPAVPVENFNTSQSATASIRTKAPASLKSMYSKALRLNRLIMLLANTRMPLTYTGVRAGGRVFELFGGSTSFDARDKVDYFDFSSHYPEIEGSFERVAGGWFGFYAKYEKSLDRYFETWTKDYRVDLGIRFLRVAQSLEAFHRAKFGPARRTGRGRPEDGTERASRCKKKPRKGRIGLEERLEDLLEIQYEILEPGMCKRRFAREVRDIRDYHSHGFIEDTEKDMPDFSGTRKHANRLDLLMHGNMVDELPLTKRLKRQIMKKKISWMRQWTEDRPRTGHRTA